MNFGNTVKKLATEFQLTLRIHKPLEGFKPDLYRGASGVLNSNDNNCKSLILKHNLIVNQKGKFFYSVPKLDLENIKRITEPEQKRIVNIELPLRNTIGGALDLPCSVEKEIAEPVGNVISKKALNMLRIRKRKMRIHQRKKYRKKHRFERVKILQKRNLEKELVFQTNLKAILKEGETFSAEKYAEDMLQKINWTPPVTKVFGRLAPSWVITEHLERKRVEANMKERIEYCQSLLKKKN